MTLKATDMRRVRGNEISIIFQEPMTSLNPVFKVGHQVMESILLHQAVSKSEARRKTVELFDEVGIPEPAQRVDSYPHQLSGGQKQRLAIARALVLNPRVLILDESTSSVDTWTERAIQDALREAQRDRTTLIISQRIRSVKHANEIIVLEQGYVSQHGKHETLINGSGLYRDMWLTQEAEAERLRHDANPTTKTNAEES